MKTHTGRVLPITVVILGLLMGMAVTDAGAQSNGLMRARAARIVIPAIQFHEASFADVVAYLGDQSRRLDPKGEGVNFVLLATSAKPVSVVFQNIRLDQAVQLIASLEELSCRFDDQAIVFDRLGSGSAGKPAAVDPKGGAMGLPDPALRARLDRIVFPEIKFRNADFRDVCAYIGDQSPKLDPKGEGINIVFQASPECPINLSLHNISAAELLKYLAALCPLHLPINPDAVVVY